MKVRGLRPTAEYHPATGTEIRPEPFEVTAEVAAQLVTAGLAEEVPEVLAERELEEPAVDAPPAHRPVRKGKE